MPEEQSAEQQVGLQYPSEPVTCGCKVWRGAVWILTVITTYVVDTSCIQYFVRSIRTGYSVWSIIDMHAAAVLCNRGPLGATT
jgi:hypothetical protein